MLVPAVGKVPDREVALCTDPIESNAMRIGRAAQLLLLVCLAFDFVHPWAPGVFFFEGDQLFVDGAVTLGTLKMPKPAPTQATQPALRVEESTRAAAQAWSSGGQALRRFAPRTEQRYVSRSSDRSSPAPSSPDAH